MSYKLSIIVPDFNEFNTIEIIINKLANLKLYNNLKKEVIIIDDYGHWSGAKSAVDDYLLPNKINPLMNYIDYSGRLWVKT